MSNGAMHWRWRSGSIGRRRPIPHFVRAVLTSTGDVRKRLATKKLAEARPDLLDYLQRFGERLVEAEERRRAAHAAELAEAALTLADAVRKVYAEEKRFRGVLDYDDLIAESLTLLKKREAAAWVLYKMDGGLDHILIDEAQDTSPEQWDIVRALTEEFFAGEGRRGADGEPRTIFAVGDEKQSIFSFQGADPVQFEVNRRHFALHAKGDGEAFVDVQLATSRRSAPEVLAVRRCRVRRCGGARGADFGGRAHRPYRPPRGRQGAGRVLAGAQAG